MEKVPGQHNIKETLPPFMREEGRLSEKLEKSQQIRNMIKEKISEIELRTENRDEKKLTSDEYFDIYGTIIHLMPAAKAMGEWKFVERLERQNDLIEKIKKARQEEKFKKITSRMSFRQKGSQKHL